MVGIHRKGYVTIAMAVRVAVEKWYPGEEAAEDERGGGRFLFTHEQADGSVVDVVEPTAAESTRHHLLEHLFSGALPSYVLADDGQILEITPQYWGSRQAEAEPQLEILLPEDMPSYPILTRNGPVQGRPVIKLNELKDLLDGRPAQWKAQEPYEHIRSPTAPPGSTESADQPSQAKPGRTQPERSRAKARLKELFGDQIPTQEEMSNGHLLQAVNKGLPKERQIGKDTLIRAAGRRN